MYFVFFGVKLKLSEMEPSQCVSSVKGLYNNQKRYEGNSYCPFSKPLDCKNMILPVGLAVWYFKC